MERQGFLEKWVISGTELCNTVVHRGNSTLFHRVAELRVGRAREQTGEVRRDMTLKNLLEYGLIPQVMEIIEEL